MGYVDQVALSYFSKAAVWVGYSAASSKGAQNKWAHLYHSTFCYFIIFSFHTLAMVGRIVHTRVTQSFVLSETN